MPPVKQAGRGRGAGSEIQFALGSGTLAIEIQRLLRIKKKFDFVGWHLWLRGYEVDAQYWRLQIEAQRKLIKRLPALRRWADIKYQCKNSTIFDEFDVETFRGFPVFKPLSKLDRDSKAYVFGVMTDIATGQFANFQSNASPDDRDDRRTFFSAMGFSKAEWAIDLARQLGFLDQLEIQLQAISLAFAEIQKTNVSAIETFDPDARMEFSDAIALASNMELLTSNALGRNQSILNVGSKILNADNRQLQAQLFLIWHYYRKQQTILSKVGIHELLELTKILIASIEGIAEFKKVLKKPN